jgi:hypothetical protein
MVLLVVLVVAVPPQTQAHKEPVALAIHQLLHQVREIAVALLLVAQISAAAVVVEQELMVAMLQQLLWQ